MLRNKILLNLCKFAKKKEFIVRNYQTKKTIRTYQSMSN
jgi:hypothetical protein